jgi:hypothetical protein
MLKCDLAVLGQASAYRRVVPCVAQDPQSRTSAQVIDRNKGLALDLADQQQRIVVEKDVCPHFSRRDVDAGPVVQVKAGCGGQRILEADHGILWIVVLLHGLKQ